MWCGFKDREKGNKCVGHVVINERRSGRGNHGRRVVFGQLSSGPFPSK
jgi:hypothetical protein